MLCVRSLLETLPRDARRPFGIGSLAQQYDYTNLCLTQGPPILWADAVRRPASKHPPGSSMRRTWPA
jgi:hypothetical protein